MMLNMYIAFARRERHTPARGRKWTAADEWRYWGEMCKTAYAMPGASLEDIAHTTLETATAHEVQNPNKSNNFDRDLIRRPSHRTQI